MALITVTRASELVTNFNGDDVKVMNDIVNACSDLIEKYCNRTFSVTNYDELMDGTGHQNLILNAYPLTKITRIMFNPTQVISIGNTGSTVSRASYRMDATNLYLEAVVNGTLYSHTIARSSCTLFSDLAAAINAYSAEGWQAQALGIYSNWLVSDLYAPQGGQEVRWSGYGYVWHHAWGVPYVMSNATVGEVVSPFPFQRGYQNYRAIYSAGFTTVPDDIQQACAELSAAVYLQREVNPNLQSESLGGYSYSQIAEKTFDNLSIASKYALGQYRNVRIAKYKVY